MIVYHDDAGRIIGYQIVPEQPMPGRACLQIDTPMMQVEDDIQRVEAGRLVLEKVTVERPDTAAIAALLKDKKISGGKLVAKSLDELDEEAAEAAEAAVLAARRGDYPAIQDQLDLMYWDQVNGTKKWRDTIAAVKAKHPKGAK